MTPAEILTALKSATTKLIVLETDNPPVYALRMEWPPETSESERIRLTNVAADAGDELKLLVLHDQLTVGQAFHQRMFVAGKADTGSGKSFFDRWFSLLCRYEGLDEKIRQRPAQMTQEVLAA